MRASWKRSSTRSVLILLLAVAVLTTGCGADSASNEVVGVVSQVTGDGTVTSFVIIDADGASHAFVPAPGLTCDGEPIEHLRAHLLERDRISVRFETTGGGAPIAVEITHLDD